MNKDIKLDKNGNIDTQYYIDRAYEMRREYNTELFQTVKAKLSKLLRITLPNVVAIKHAHH